MRPNLAYFDVPDHFVAGGAGGEDDTRVGLLCTLKVSFKLCRGQRILEKACTPLNEISLTREPRDQAREVLATKGMERYAICWWGPVDHPPIQRELEIPQPPLLPRRKAVEPCRIVDQNLLEDRRSGGPLRQLVDLRTVVARIGRREIFTGLAAARVRPIRAPQHTVRVGVDQRLGDRRRIL